MRQIILLFIVTLPLIASAADKLPVAPPPHLAAKKVQAVVVTSLKTGQSQIRQYAFDDDPNTYFESEKNAAKTDHFTLQLDAPVAVASVQVLTGKPTGGEMLDNGVVEISTDGKKFETVAKFQDGIASTNLKNKSVKAIRIRPTEDLNHPLVLREIVIDSKPKVAVFKYPVEFVIDVSDAPEMKDWTEKCAQICERNYGMICDELMSPGFKPLNVIHMTMKNDYNGVAEAGGGRIKGSVKFFKAHPDDVGAMIHETAHCVQLYKVRGNPGWLVEGVADYVRFFKYEPGKIGRINVDQAKYNGSYRVTASFLNYVTTQYDPRLVIKLNAIMRDGKYQEEVWKELTGKTVEELNQEWRRTLVR
jgi:hypothetical protein